MNEFSNTGEMPVGMIIFIVLISILMIASTWKVFVKAGKPGWYCLIPIWSGIVMLDIVGKPRWWFLLFLIPLVNYVFIIWTYNMLSKSFGKSEGFTVGLIFLGIVFLPILGFGDSKYLGPFGLNGSSQDNGGENILDHNV